MRRVRDYSPMALEAARLLGGRIRLARQERRWTIDDLAERVGAARGTIRKVEHGDMSVALGVALEAAALLRVPLFHEDPSVRALELRRVEDSLSLLPSRVSRPPEVDDDF